MLHSHSIDYGHDMGKPLGKFNLFQTKDADEAREVVSKVYCDHTLEPVHAGALDACHNRVRLSSLSVNYMQYGADVNVEPGTLDSFYLFQLPINGAAKITTGDKEFITTTGMSSAINPNDYTKMLWNKDCKKLMVQVRKEAMEARLSRLLMHPIDKPILFDPCIQKDNKFAHDWWRQIKHLVSDLDHDMNPWRSSHILEDMERNLLTSLLFSFNHNYLETLHAQERHVAPKYVKQAEDYILKHLKEPLSLEKLVEVTGVSQRSIFNGFKSFRGTSPMKFILQSRLKKVREELMQPAQNKTVTDIAVKWNFTQLGRFSVSYKKVYGESPSETLRK